MRVVYLHGFASGPSSRKARHFSEKLGACGRTVEALDLAPDFEHLTISSQLAVMENAIQNEPVVLIGSSMGGYLAALYAVQHPEVERLALLAPAFDVYQLLIRELGPKKLGYWRKNGSVPIFHYGTGRKVPIGYQLLEDAGEYPPFPNFPQPCLIMHGVNDMVVPFENSARFAACHSNVTLIPFESNHELTDVLEEIWKSASNFLAGDDTGSI